VAYARVMRQVSGGGASAQPSNAGTVTRPDGSFELAGIPAGRVSISIGADSFNDQIESGLTASEGQTLGPVAIAMTPLAPGSEPKIEVVGIGVKLAPDGDDLLVQEVIKNGGAQAAGIVAGDRIVSVDGVSVTELGLDNAVSAIRGAPNTTVSIGLRRGVVLVVTRTKLQA
jgi:predicted metalloprotease with PDZ domain